MSFVNAYRKDTGQKVRVPESHLRIFPGALSKTPRQKAAEKKTARAAVTTPAEAPAAADPKEDA
ncbi:MAG TPA: hypothetical protein VEP72_01865 [Microbacterium sp.]|nr:hypothetical protein [Microbacterium sp.]